MSNRDGTLVIYVCRGCQMTSLATLPDNARFGLPRFTKSGCCAINDQRPWLARRISNEEFGEVAALQLTQSHEELAALLKQLPTVEEHEVRWADGGMVSPQ